MPDVSEELVTVLSKLDEETIFNLARTVTQGLKKSRTTEEAIQNIIKYSPNELSILRRKAVTRDILFTYLDENDVTVKLPITKNELIDLIANLWKISPIAAPSQDNIVAVGNNASSDIKGSEEEECTVNKMAEEFAKWFYSMLNGNECGPEHFFDDAKLKINMYNNEDCDTTVIENDPEEIQNILLQTRLQHKLYFNPNDSQEGVQGRMDPHGLVMVLTCGTLHIENICAGVFEQVFALARDPFSDNNWKIKSTELNLRSKSSVLETPRLCDSDLTSELLMLPSE